MKRGIHAGAIAFFVLAMTRADAQQIHQALASGGGDASGANGSVSYTIGQMSYTTMSGASGTSASGIQITVNLGNPLPVTLLRFEGECTGGKVNLSWQTGTGINNGFFIVEKSADAQDWVSIASLKSEKEPKTYSFTDDWPAAPVAYYRLKQVDPDGAFSYSTVIHVVNCNAKTHTITLYPNPTATGVYLTADNTGDAEYQLYDTKGILLRSGRMQNGTSYIDLSPWAAGTYFLKIRQKNIFLNSFSIIKK